MCLSTPDIPTPPAPQEQKQPESVALAKAKRKGATMAGGTMLTGPSGVASNALNTGAPSLLGS